MISFGGSRVDRAGMVREEQQVFTFRGSITRDEEGLNGRDHEEEENEKGVEGEIPVDLARSEWRGRSTENDETESRKTVSERPRDNDARGGRRATRNEPRIEEPYSRREDENEEHAALGEAYREDGSVDEPPDKDDQLKFKLASRTKQRETKAPVHLAPLP